MPDAFTIEFDFRGQRFSDAEAGLRAFYATLNADWEARPRRCRARWKAFLDQVVEAIAQRNSGGWPGGTTATSLSKRSGALVNAILGSVTVNGTTFEDIARLDRRARHSVRAHPGDRRHHQRQERQVPLHPAAGGARRQRPADQVEPARLAEHVLRQVQGRQPLIFQKRGTTIMPLYVLKTSVTIPPRLNMRTTLEAGMPYFVDRAMDAMVREVRRAEMTRECDIASA